MTSFSAAAPGRTRAAWTPKLSSERMGFQDRSYYREGGGTTSNPLMWLLNGSVPLFTVWGVRVRMHATLLIFMILQLVFSGGPNGIGPRSALTSMAILFISVLLHEF